MPWPIHRWLFFYCISITVLKDCQSLFLRHNQTGKCIKPEGLVYSGSTWAKPYWAVMTDNCLDDKAQFRYLNTELLRNVNTGGTFAYSQDERYKEQLVMYKALDSRAKPFQNSINHRLKQTDAGSLYLYKSNRCAEPSKTSKYVNGIKQCNKPAQMFIFGSVIQYNAKMKDVHCSPKQHMVVHRADYGDFNNGGTFDITANTDKKCSILTNCQIKSLCGGKKSCELNLNNSLLPAHYCSDNSKQIYTEYTCVDNYNSNSITGPNVRLSESPNEGYIEIKNGSTWRKVKEENWDKNREKMLCQHLGFNGTDGNDISTRQLGKNQKIATGDLICYNTRHASGISCCVHLQPSTTTSSVDMPYVTCGKICDKPLLQNLPNSVFSGSGGSSDYEQAKFNNDGWCATRLGTKHLLIDLQKEYHITRVLTMGDKDQTGWSGSYSLKYSHNESFVDQNSVQITGNQNGYQASIRTVDIYDVRHIKMESSGNTNFCLRIELCGEVQSPAPVQKIVPKPSNFSVHLSWTIPAPKASSYITHFIIYLNGTEMQRISRAKYGNQFVLHGLKPYTGYNVGIKAQDGSLKNATLAFTSFRTEEAVPSGPPSNVAFKSRRSDSLKISWKAPDKKFWNGELTGYQVCYSSPDIGEKQKCLHTDESVLSYSISELQPSTKYFVTVAAGTKIGYGNKSSEFTEITNGESVNPVVISYSSLSLYIAKQATYIKGVMVIVQIATGKTVSSEDIETNKLQPHSENKKNPYVTAYLNASSLPLTFGIGDGKEYNSKNEKYSNQPLQQNSSYILFLRFFEDQDLFYSTKWSSIVRTMAKPPAPIISKIISTGLKNYTIFWFQPLLPDQQTVLKYYITYMLPNGSIKNLNVSKKTTSFGINVEFDKKYTFEIQVETKAGKSDTTSESWFSHSEPLTSPEKTEFGYTVILKKPRENIKSVALIMLQSNSSNPPSPEGLTVQDSPPKNKEANNVAFMAMEFTIKYFENDDLVVSLREPRNNQRRKKRAAKNVYIALVPNATYRTTQRNLDKSGKYSWSYWSIPFSFTKAIGSPITTPTPTTLTESKISTPEERIDDSGSGGGSAGAAVGASIAVVVIVVAVVLAVVYFRRRRALQRYSGKEFVRNDDNFDDINGIQNGGSDGEDGVKMEDRPANEDIYSNQAGYVDEKEHPAVPVAEFAHYVNELKANENYEFQKEYDELPSNTNTSWEVAKKPFNKQKNRYGNIVTYDHCRVVLSGDDDEDYINASYIDGIKTNSYIASQGPTKLTIDDMWRMVWEKHTYSIVMVTSLVELGKPKCEKYWPDKGTEEYGDIEVTLMKTEEFAYHVTHILQLKKDGEEREVRHYYFQSWPDHGVPKYPTQLLAFRRHFRTHHLKQSGPIVVHCSAGVGRTGVFLAIDTILDKLEKGVISSIDVFWQVSAMRERRMNMVQTLEQYIFIHEAILETILCGMNEVDSSRIQKEVKNLAEVKASGMTGFQEKFKRLGEVSPKLSEDECIAGLLEENNKKNRNKNIYPAECNRVPLQYVYGVENSDYINAVFVHGYLGRNYFIATQSPLPNTINDFWRLVHLQKSSTIVLLNNVKEGTSFPKFWPTNRGVPQQYGSLTVQLDSERESDAVRTRKFILSPYPDLTDGQVVTIFQYTKWPDHRVPPNGSGVITLTSLVEKSRQSHGEGPVIVACSDGAGRTGTYIAISNLLERMKIEQTMDVFQAIKIIRGTRPQFVENAEQYQFCYTAIMAYLDAFSEYANFE